LEVYQTASIKGEFMFNRVGIFVGTIFLAASSAVYAHDARLHGDNASTGEVVRVSKDGFDLKTKTDTIKVKLAKTTKFELDGKAVDKNPVRKGQRVGVVGAKAGDEVTAEQVIVLPATNAAPAAK
jgi:hypothetical protein